MPSDTEPLRKGSGDSAYTFTTSESYSRSSPDPDRRYYQDEGGRRQHSREEYEPDKERRRRRRERDRQDSYDLDRRERHRNRDRDRDRDRDRERKRRDYDADEDDRERRRARRERRHRRREREREREREVQSPVVNENIRHHHDLPPPYDEKSSRGNHRKNSKDSISSPKGKRQNSLQQLALDEEKANPQPTNRHLTKLERFGGPWIYIVPLLASFCLLAASTCSSDWWRKDVNVIRLGLPGDVYARMLATANNLGKGGGEGTEKVDSGGKVEVESRAAKIIPQGWLSVGFWGWCVAPDGDGPWACSETDAWYTMDELLETAAVTTTIPTDAYFVGLMHGIVVHGLAMVATMSATVPAGILIWRRYIRDNRNIPPGLALHATIFAGSAFSFIAFVIDKALEARVRNQTKYPVEQGSVPIMVGVSALLLFLAFLISIAPGIHRRVKRQQEYAGSWEDVIVAATELERPVSASTTATGLTRSKTWRKMKGLTGFHGRGRGRR